MVKTKKKSMKILSLVLILIVVVLFLTTVANVFTVKSCMEKASSYSAVKFEEQLVPEKDAKGNWVFTTDRDFKVLHITDIHLGSGYMSLQKDKKSINAVATMVTREKPDLVIASGDIAYPVPFQAGTFNNKSGAKEFANLMETLGVYWTITFGNHDTEAYSYYSREDISAFYMNEDFKHCLYEPGPENIDGYGNHVIEVKNSKGLITQSFVMLDSHSYTDGDIFGIQWKYDNIKQSQVDWYEAEIERMTNENKEALSHLSKAEKKSLKGDYSTVKSLAFFHIPLKEMRDGWSEFVDNGFKDTENVKYIGGIIGEKGKRVYCGIGEDEFFESILELNSTKAMFNGHDHYNNVTFSYKNVIFSYGYSVDYLAYPGISKEGSQRGCTLITCKPDTTFEIEKFLLCSDRYDVEGFERDEVELQFKDVEYQVEE